MIWRDFIEITKPGIIRSNALASLAGFFLASQRNIDWSLLIVMLIGSSLVLASSCVFNNILDINFDRKMERTKQRPLAIGSIKPSVALAYGTVLGIVGLTLLFNINWIAGLLGIAGMFVYIVIYTLWLKRYSIWSTSIGGISGAMPPVIGYVAVSGAIDLAAIILFAILFLWQPPHFWALGIRRKAEYEAAGYPLLPVVKGIRRTKLQMLPYVLLLIPTSLLLYTFGYVGIFYFLTATLLGVLWLGYCITGFTAHDDQAWATKSFKFSIYYLMLLLIVMAIDTKGAAI